MEASYPETARVLAMNAAEIVYRPSYPAGYYLSPESQNPY
jgi:hypothetical protein